MRETPAVVRDEKVFGRWDYPAFLSLSLLVSASAAHFAWRWFSQAEWSSRPLVLGLLTAALALRLSEQAARWLMLPLMRRPIPMPARPGLKVAVVTTFVPAGEPLAMLEKTLAALVALDYTHDTWVLDEGDDASVRALCAKLGASHFSRRRLPQYQTEAGPFRSRSKHGNYNAWLSEIGFDRYEIVSAFDPDHVPRPDFLSNVLGYFADARVGYVQAPAAYYNQSAGFVARGAAEETYSYYSCTQQAAYAAGHPFVTGCHNTHRVEALREAGGFAPHNADDLLLTLIYRGRGWRGVYVPRVLARGLAPVDWGGYLTQQLRWARSILDVKFRLAPRLGGEATLKDRLVTFLDGLVYLQGGATTALLLLALCVALAAGRDAYLPPRATVFEFAAVCSVLQLAAFYRQRFFLDPRRERGLHLRCRVLRYAKWPHVLLAFADVLGGRAAPYTLTAKVKGGARGRSSLRPHLLTVFAVGGAWLAGALAGRQVHPLLHACAAFVLAGTLALLLTERLSFPDPYADPAQPAADRGLSFEAE
jgi:hypothetical protein